jgi:hypothetical protein
MGIVKVGKSDWVWSLCDLGFGYNAVFAVDRIRLTGLDWIGMVGHRQTRSSPNLAQRRMSFCSQFSHERITRNMS